MDTIYFILGIIFFISLITYRVWSIINIPESENTFCPKCGKEKLAVPSGKYMCDTCGTKFTVDDKGNAEIPPLSKIYGSFYIGLTLFLIPMFLYFIFNIKEMIDSRLIILPIAGVFLIIQSGFQYIEHRKRYG